MATLSDVAKLAGVSTATVSNVVTSSRAVRASTRARVEIAIAQLGFVPNAATAKANLEIPVPASSGRTDSTYRMAIRPSAHNARTMLRIIRAAQPISRVDLARRLEVHRSTVTEIVTPLIASGVLREGAPERGGASRRGRPPIGLTLRDDGALFIGVNIGVRRTQVGAATAAGLLLEEESFETFSDSQATLTRVDSIVGRLQESQRDRTLLAIGVSVPGPTDAARRELLFAPHLGWRNVPIAEELSRGVRQRTKGSNVSASVIVDNDATAAAMYEERRRSRDWTRQGGGDFVLVRVGTGIGVGLVVGGEVYRGTGTDRGLLGEFGHMTVVAGGKLCACGNRGCWELYASATSAAALYAGERAARDGTRLMRFVEIVARAEAGEVRAQATLERVGKYLGIGIGNLITGLGVSRVVVSGRIVHGWKFVHKSVREAVSNTMAGRLSNWSLEQGQPTGAGLGGALEIAVEPYLTQLASSTRVAA